MVDVSVNQLIARRLKDFRARQGLSLRDLATRAGVSAAMISEIERGSKSPTISILSALARALGAPLSQLVDEESPAGRLSVVRSSEHRAVKEGKGITRRHLGPTLHSSNVEFIRIDLAAGAKSGIFAPHSSGSIERVHVGSGSVNAYVGNETVLLDAGDSLVFPGDQPHWFRNGGAAAAVIYAVIEP
ncbi:MAG TPA: XRE family transcriptional regulator [Candidatus Aquilonibacter sp.]